MELLNNQLGTVTRVVKLQKKALVTLNLAYSVS
jgi:hypothetical protein